jgi:hypothetical protein
VVLGGIHASACPDEAARHADAVVVGEAEGVWGEALRDAAACRLRSRYQGDQPGLAGLVQPIDGKLKGNYQFRAFFTMRGCPYACSFCSVHHFFGRTIRYRPVEEVAAEIEARAGRVWFNGDDNIWGADPDRAVRLFDALAAGGRRAWYGFGDLRSVQGPQGERLLTAARRSGLTAVWAGWESDSEASLKAFGAAGKQGRDRVEAIRRMQGHGLEVVLFMVLGAREDDHDAYLRSLELADRLRVGVHPVLLTPLPGTALYERYRPHLLPGLGWEAFSGVRAVYEHPDPRMTPAERERQFHELSREIYRPRRMLRRLGAIHRSGFPVVHGLSLMSQLPMRHALGKARRAWLAEQAAATAAALPAPAALAAVSPPASTQAPRRTMWLHRAAIRAWAAALASATAAAAAEASVADEAAHLLDHAGDGLVGLGWLAASLAIGSGAWALRGRAEVGRPALGARRTAAVGLALTAALAWQVALTW